MGKAEVEARKEYREKLETLAKESQNSYDQTLIALSGGALGISFAFVDHFTGTGPITRPEVLIAAWICWAVSLGSVLFSFYTSHLALRNAIQQVDGSKPINRRLGGIPDWFTSLLNFLSGFTFVLGVAAMIWFVFVNFK